MASFTFDTPTLKAEIKTVAPHLIRKKKDKIVNYLSPSFYNMPTTMPETPKLKPVKGDLSKIEELDLEARIDALLKDFKPTGYAENKEIPVYVHEGVALMRDCTTPPPEIDRAMFQSPRSVLTDVIDLRTPEHELTPHALFQDILMECETETDDSDYTSDDASDDDFSA